MSREDRIAAKAERRAAKAEARLGEKIEDAYDESERTMSHDEACRDSVYSTPSMLTQIGICYMTQMKRFTKQRTIWTVLTLLIAIPVLYYVFTEVLTVNGAPLIDPHWNVANIGMATVLALAPVITIFLSTNLCGAMLPQEFNERTAYLSLPLPMSRFSFYIGKFLSGFTLVMGVTAMAYGISIAIVLPNSNLAYTSNMFSSLITMVAGVFFFCAFSYMLSAKSKRGATMKSLLILLIGLPILAFALSYVFYTVNMDVLCPITGYFPCFIPDVAVMTMGTPQLSMMSGTASLYGMLNAFGVISALPGFELCTDTVVVSAIAMILGILCLMRGYHVISRRDM